MSTRAIDISVVIPCRNEERHIATTIRHLLRQKGLGERFACEILLIDGKSTDRTVEVIRREQQQSDRIKLIINERQITPVAFNLGIHAAAGRYICILGAHAEISEDYLLSCLETMSRVDADNVGGPWRVKGQGYCGEAIALAFQNPFSCGWAKGHDLTYEGYLDTVWGGFYKREVFDRIGVFDETLVRNQDDELNYRLTQHGGKIWQSPTIRYGYICRQSVHRLWLQYLQYGYWKVKVLQKHKMPTSMRQLVPAMFVLTLTLLACLSLFLPIARLVLICELAVYGLAAGAFAVAACARPSRWKFLPMLPIVFATYHLSYGIGFLRGVLDWCIAPKRHAECFTKVTRG